MKVKSLQNEKKKINKQKKQNEVKKQGDIVIIVKQSRKTTMGKAARKANQNKKNIDLNNIQRKKPPRIT